MLRICCSFVAHFGFGRKQTDFSVPDRIERFELVRDGSERTDRAIVRLELILPFQRSKIFFKNRQIVY